MKDKDRDLRDEIRAHLEMATADRVERGVERPCVDLQDITRSRLDRLGDPVAVPGAPLQGLQHEEVEGSLEELDAVPVAFASRHLGCR